MTSEATSGLLPADFKRRMNALSIDDYDGFVASFDAPRTRALRLNPLKTDKTELEALLEFQLEPVPWCTTGYYLPEGISLGGHPAHLAGLFYLQEPSAMAVAELVATEHMGSIVDLAAAPGGKTTHLASLVAASEVPDGVVIANEVAGSRLRPLHDNLDLWGSDHVLTTNLALDQLADTGLLVDVAVLDAPCTGEALFRRDPTAIRQWSAAAVDGAARRQHELLAVAAGLVRPGGVLVYSTCSFEIEENEQQIADLVAESDDWTIEDVAGVLNVSPGRPIGSVPTDRTARFWPHLHHGEGQYVAKLRRTASAAGSPERPRSAKPHRRKKGSRRRSDAGLGGVRSSSRADVIEGWEQLRAKTAPDFVSPPDRLVVVGDRLFLAPKAAAGTGQGSGDLGPMLDRVRKARPGLPLGRLRPGRFEPHPGLATVAELGFDPELSNDYRVSWHDGDPELAAYLRGETVEVPGPDGWVLVCYRRWGIGWARRSKGMLKNLFPQHLRRQAAAHARRATNQHKI